MSLSTSTIRYYLRGLVYLLLDEKQKADVDFTQALEYVGREDNKQDIDVHGRQALYLLASGNIVKARQLYHDLIARWDNEAIQQSNEAVITSSLDAAFYQYQSSARHFSRTAIINDLNIYLMLFPNNIESRTIYDMLKSYCIGN